jgi:hypothetical protein
MRPRIDWALIALSPRRHLAFGWLAFTLINRDLRRDFLKTHAIGLAGAIFFIYLGWWCAASV